MFFLKVSKKISKFWQFYKNSDNFTKVLKVFCWKLNFVFQSKEHFQKNLTFFQIWNWFDLKSSESFSSISDFIFQNTLRFSLLQRSQIQGEEKETGGELVLVLWYQVRTTYMWSETLPALKERGTQWFSIAKVAIYSLGQLCTNT